MKRKINAILLVVSIMSAIFTGCEKNDASSNSKSTKNREELTEESTEQITEKESIEKSATEEKNENLEKKYIERLNAYREYFDLYDKDDRYDMGGDIVLDSNKLPIMWLFFGEPQIKEDRNRHTIVKLVSYDDESGKVKVLAETSAILGAYFRPYINSVPIIKVESADDSYHLYDLIYNEEKKEFVRISDDEYKETLEKLQGDIDTCKTITHRKEIYAKIDEDNNTLTYVAEVELSDDEYDYEHMPVNIIFADGTRVDGVEDKENEYGLYSFSVDIPENPENPEKLHKVSVEDTEPKVIPYREMAFVALLDKLSRKPAYTAGDLLMIYSAVRNGYSIDEYSPDVLEEIKIAYSYYRKIPK